MKKRKRLAVGGVAEEAQGTWNQRNPQDPVQPHGLVADESAGRTDEINVSVAGGSYVIPADVVSALGQGNTANGAKQIERLFAEGLPQQQAAPAMADGGATPAGPLVPVALSGGEFVIDPPHVMQLGQGDLDFGHDVLDKFVEGVRKTHVKTLKKLPPPVRG